MLNIAITSKVVDNVLSTTCLYSGIVIGQSKFLHAHKKKIYFVLLGCPFGFPHRSSDYKTPKFGLLCLI